MTAHFESMPLEIREPATGKWIGTVETTSSDQVAFAVGRARAAQKHWAALDSTRRAQYLVAWRKLVVERGAELAGQLSLENGKPYHEALLHEVIAFADALDFIAEQAPALQREQQSTPRWFKHRHHQLWRKPRGVVAILSPFNFPLLTPGADAASALAMGCAVILKPSPHCPLIAEQLVELAHRAGIPEDVLQVVHGGDDVGQALVQSDIQALVFTGSSANGRRVARDCGSRLIPCTLELGGNCPLLVLDDADLERTARGIAFGAFTNSGQSCLAVGRVLVPNKLLEPLIGRLSDIIAHLKQGDPASRTVDLGALTTAAQLERCHMHVMEAERDGARVIAGRSPSESSESPGRFFPPTLLAGCSVNCSAFREETFGPVLPIVGYADLDQAIAVLNASPMGLTAYVFGTDLKRARAVAGSLDFGQIVVDQVLLTYVCPEVPLAGLRESGLGVVHGTDGMLAHTTPFVIGMPRVRLPTTLEFDWGEPNRAVAVAEGYLKSKTTWNRIVGWTKGGE